MGDPAVANRLEQALPNESKYIPLFFAPCRARQPYSLAGHGQNAHLIGTAGHTFVRSFRENNQIICIHVTAIHQQSADFAKDGLGPIMLIFVLIGDGHYPSIQRYATQSRLIRRKCEDRNI